MQARLSDCWQHWFEAPQKLDNSMLLTHPQRYVTALCTHTSQTSSCS